jgi:SAM-dependent methyltransferase
MDFLDLVTIAEQGMELVNPTTPEKVVALGETLHLREGSRVIDFGCGYAEPLALWAERFGIVGTGIELREAACLRARRKLEARGLSDRIEIVCADAAAYRFEPGAFDAATCLGATFIWGGYRETIRAIRRAIAEGGRLGIGEPSWLSDRVPKVFAEQERSVQFERDLLEITREEGFELESIFRSSRDDWDRYESSNWRGLIRWIEEHRGHPDRPAVMAHLRERQEEYITYGREHLGWAMYALAPRTD